MEDNNIMELFNDGEIEKKVRRKMEKIFLEYGFVVNLREDDDDFIQKIELAE